MKGYFTLLFSFLRDIGAPAQHDAVVGRLIAALTGSGEAAPLRLNM